MDDEPKTNGEEQQTEPEATTEGEVKEETVTEEAPAEGEEAA